MTVDWLLFVAFLAVLKPILLPILQLRLRLFANSFGTLKLSAPP